MVPRSLKDARRILNRVGWFIPPYAQMQFIYRLCDLIDRKPDFNQTMLQAELAQLYTPWNLAAMVAERYPITPQLLDYKTIIAESVEAHVLGLHHIAFSGLAPVIEVAGRALAAQRGLTPISMKDVFTQLADDCKTEVIARNYGAVDEVIEMLDSFREFAKSIFYRSSSDYPLDDNTNRHGALHGTFSDSHYGEPINFYKTIASIDFLCFISAIRGNLSCLSPDPTTRSHALANYYAACHRLGAARPTC